MNETVMDNLYTNFAGPLGWLSRLIETFGLNSDEIAYLEWRDRCNDWPLSRLKLWDTEIAAYGGPTIYFESDSAKQFVMLTELVERDPRTELLRTRSKLKSALLKQIEPDIVEEITEADIACARLYPLWRLMGLSRPKNIKCPYHDDSNPSFQVSVWGFCHTCKAHKDSIAWLMAESGISFVRAVKELARK